MLACDGGGGNARYANGDDGNARVDPKDVEQVLLAAVETIGWCMQPAPAERSVESGVESAPAGVSPVSNLPEYRSEGKIDSLVRDAGTKTVERDGHSRKCEEVTIERIEGVQRKRWRCTCSCEGHSNKRHRSSSPSGSDDDERLKKSKKRVSVFERLAFPVTPAGKEDFFLEPGALEGMIFGCTSDTKVECERLKLFGLPASNHDNVLRVAPGTVLFLFNYDTKELSGVYEAVSYGAMNIVANAFEEWGSFPAQVEVRRVLKCQDLPFHRFKTAILDNFFTDKKFHYDLTGYQVDSLVEMFRAVLL